MKTKKIHDLGWSLRVSTPVCLAATLSDAAEAAPPSQVSLLPLWRYLCVCLFVDDVGILQRS